MPPTAPHVGDLPVSLADRALRLDLKRKRAGEDVTALGDHDTIEKVAERANVVLRS